jgi:GR25 family glycosyltransferase involved in LPS biosynthesis
MDSNYIINKIKSNEYIEKIKTHILSILHKIPFVFVINFIDETSIIENIISNYRCQCHLNKKLFLVTNNNLYTFHQSEDIELWVFKDCTSIGECYNLALKKIRNFYETNSSLYTYIYAIFNNYSIYEPNFLTEQVKALISKQVLITIKSDIIAFIPNIGLFCKIHNVHGGIVFVYMPNIEFDSSVATEDQIINKFITKYSSQKIGVTSDKNLIFICKKRNLNANIVNKCHYNFDPTSCSKLINHIFDKIYVVNLEQETLMKKIFVSNNSMHDLKFTFWKGTFGKNDSKCIQIFDNIKNKTHKILEHNELYDNPKIKKKKIIHIGEVGYLMSTINILKDAKINSYERIIIFDDDVLLCENFSQKFIKVYLNIPSDWNIIRIGSSWYRIPSTNAYVNSFKDGYFITKPTVGSFANCYKSNCFDKLIKESEKFDSSYDSGPLNSIGEKDYTLNPNLAIADLFRSLTSGTSRSLYTCSRLLKWNLDAFHFICSIRKVTVVLIIKENVNNDEILNNILNQTYFNIEIIAIHINEKSLCISSDFRIVNEYIENDDGEEINKLVQRNMTGDHIIYWNCIRPLNTIELEMNKIIKQSPSVHNISDKKIEFITK